MHIITGNTNRFPGVCLCQTQCIKHSFLFILQRPFLEFHSVLIIRSTNGAMPLGKLATLAATAASSESSDTPVASDEEYYSSWSLFLVCVLLILSLWTSYYLQIKRIRAVHETLVSIFAGMTVGLIIRLAPGTMIREMLVSIPRHGLDADCQLVLVVLFCLL